MSKSPPHVNIYQSNSVEWSVSMATHVTWFMFLLEAAALIWTGITLQSVDGLPQLPDVFFPDSTRDQETLAILCRQQVGHHLCREGNPQLLGQQQQQPSSPVVRGGACSSVGAGRSVVTDRVHGCNLMDGEVMWPGDASRCAQLLTQGPCPPGHWVILSNDIVEESICAPRICGGGDEVLMNGQCYRVNDRSMCPPTMTLQPNEFGTGECECPPKTVYHQGTNQCYSPYSQGPCQQGFIIKAIDVDEQRGGSECVRNSCPSQNMVPIDQQCRLVTDRTSIPSECHNINTPGPCSNGNLNIDGSTAEAGCSDRAIFDNIGIPCRRGSRQDLQGRCRKIFNGGRQLGGRLPLAGRQPLRGRQPLGGRQPLRGRRPFGGRP